MKIRYAGRSIVYMLTWFVLFMTGITNVIPAQTGVRKEIGIPDIRGYITMKCDFHTHTVFSDGVVWPSARVEEVWREGIDVLSITDHIEYLPHKNDVIPNFNRPYELAQPSAERLIVMLIKGAEITRSLPPGHYNALFLNDVNPVNAEVFLDAVKAAADQDAFIFYNHPGWRQPDGKAVWYPETGELYEKGWLHGVEVVNGKDYYPLAHAWCLEKKLTMLGNSDVHDPITFDYDFQNGEHRPITLVFVKEKTEKGLKEALFARRTAVYWNNIIIGEGKFLKPIFDESVEIINPEVSITGSGGVSVQIRNTSDIKYDLTADGESDSISFPKNITLYPHRTVLLPIQAKQAELSGRKKINIPFRVTNLLIAPDTGLSVQLMVRITFIPAVKP
ncbi:Sb-PDE family phosphodiesterase [bacterium]|nr:Sb-PDE family phosphodiesterase [bacterium]